MAEEKRFIITDKQGVFTSPCCKVIVDRETGVNYLWMESGYAGGLTPLLNRDGKPVVSPLPVREE